MAATSDQLTEVNEIGPKIAASIIAFMADEDNIKIINRLKSNGLQLESSGQEKVKESDILTGKSVVISGVFTKHTRDEYKDIIEKHGGKNVSSISGNTSFIQPFKISSENE